MFKFKDPKKTLYIVRKSIQCGQKTMSNYMNHGLKNVSELGSGLAKNHSISILRTGVQKNPSSLAVIAGIGLTAYGIFRIIKGKH